MTSGVTCYICQHDTGLELDECEIYVRPRAGWHPAWNSVSIIVCPFCDEVTEGLVKFGRVAFPSGNTPMDDRRRIIELVKTSLVPFSDIRDDESR